MTFLAIAFDQTLGVGALAVARKNEPTTCRQFRSRYLRDMLDDLIEALAEEQIDRAEVIALLLPDCTAHRPPQWQAELLCAAADALSCQLRCVYGREVRHFVGAAMPWRTVHFDDCRRAARSTADAIRAAVEFGQSLGIPVLRCDDPRKGFPITTALGKGVAGLQEWLAKIDAEIHRAAEAPEHVFSPEDRRIAERLNELRGTPMTATRH